MKMFVFQIVTMGSIQTTILTPVKTVQLLVNCVLTIQHVLHALVAHIYLKIHVFCHAHLDTLYI